MTNKVWNHRTFCTQSCAQYIRGVRDSSNHRKPTTHTNTICWHLQSHRLHLNRWLCDSTFIKARSRVHHDLGMEFAHFYHVAASESLHYLICHSILSLRVTNVMTPDSIHKILGCLRPCNERVFCLVKQNWTTQWAHSNFLTLFLPVYPNV